MSWLDLTDTKETGGFEPLPTGEYLVQLQEAVLTPTKAGTGDYLKCTFEIVGPGTGRGRKLFHNFNIRNPNQMAVQIGMESLKNFMMSAGCKTFKLDTPKNLEGLSAMAKVVVEEDDKYGPQNRITYFSKYDEAKHSKPASANGAKKTPAEELGF